MFLNLSCWLENPQQSLTASGQSFFHQPFRLMKFRTSMDSFSALDSQLCSWCPTFTNTNTCLTLTCIQAIVENTVSVRALGCCAAAGVKWCYLANNWYEYLDGSDQDPADALGMLSRAKQNVNTKFLDFTYCSTSQTKQLLHQSNSKCFVTEAFLLDLKTLTNDSCSSP